LDCGDGVAALDCGDTSPLWKRRLWKRRHRRRTPNFGLRRHVAALAWGVAVALPLW